jgi:hypothetical protein
MRWVAPSSLLVFAASCVGRLPHPPYAKQPTASLTVVGYPPPPARVEFVPASPAKGAVWIDGEWVWQGRRWAWRLGRWVQPPAGARFSPWTTVRGDDGTTYYAPGAWRDAEGQELAAPGALATARPNLSDVVDPEGELENTGRSIKASAAEALDAGADADVPVAPDPDRAVDAGGKRGKRAEREDRDDAGEATDGAAQP